MNYGIVTVDTEGHDGKDPVSKLIWGETDKGLWGIDLIMDVCDQHSVSALFFVDFAECWDYGEEKVAKVVQHILERKHHVGVHIHPDHMADPSRMFLWEYSLEEQRDILTKCTRKYEQITGQKPVMFRAGKYGANRDTLQILDELGYRFDFSQFYGQKWCHIAPPIAINRPRRFGNLTEIPVTSFRSFHFGKWKKIEKVDMEMSPSQFNYAINQFAKNDGLVISLFFHSFSMLNWREDPDAPTPCQRNYRKIQKALNKITRTQNVQLIDPDQLQDIIGACAAGEEDELLLDIRNPFVSYYFIFMTCIRIAKFNPKARLFLLAQGLVLLCLIGLLF